MGSDHSRRRSRVGLSSPSIPGRNPQSQSTMLRKNSKPQPFRRKTASGDRNNAKMQRKRSSATQQIPIPANDTRVERDSHSVVICAVYLHTAVIMPLDTGCLFVIVGKNDNVIYQTELAPSLKVSSSHHEQALFSHRTHYLLACLLACLPAISIISWMTPV